MAKVLSDKDYKRVMKNLDKATKACVDEDASIHVVLYFIGMAENILEKAREQ